MSDFERGKYYGKKKYNAQRSDRSDSSKSAYGSRFFNKSVYNPDKDSKESDVDSKPKKQILIKAREKTDERSVSPKRKENEHVGAHKESASVEAHAVPILKTMTKSAKLLDEGILYPENLQDYLSESSEFLVVGIIGPQGVGKSTIMNLLATEHVTQNIKKSLFKLPDEADDDSIKILSDGMSRLTTDDANRDSIFRNATVEDLEGCTNTTNGIDMYITENRVILLDCQPFLSISVFDDLIRSELKRSNLMGDFQQPENVGEMQGLLHVAFLMSVCHVLIFAQDFFLDTNNIRFLHTAEMLKPTISNTEEEYLEQFPHLLIVHNKAQLDDFSPQRFKIMQQLYRKMFVGSKLHLESSMGLGTGKIIPSLCPDMCGEPINLFLLPEYQDETEILYKGHPSFDALVKRLKTNVNCVTKYPITHVQLTEKTWLVYCAKVWDHVKKSSFYVEYTKLMP